MGFRMQVDHQCATVFLEGRLAFGSYPDFRAATMSALDLPEVQVIHLDMSVLDYMDSSALGMILHFKQKADLAKKTLAIIRPSPQVATVLKVVNFDRLISILP